MPDDSAAEPSKIETEQLLRQMNDNWARALVRSDAETLRQIMAEDFSLLIRLKVMIGKNSSET